MTPNEILEELIRTFPEFRACWNESRNLSRDDDGTFTGCGVFSQFTDFFREQHEKLSKESLTALASLIARAETDASFADAAFTCFLENIAGDPPDATLAPYLTPKAREFMSHWRPRG